MQLGTLSVISVLMSAGEAITESLLSLLSPLAIPKYLTFSSNNSRKQKQM